MSGAGWVQCKLGDQITLQRGKDITKSAAIEGPVPVISSGGVSFMHNDPWSKGPGVLLGRKGSVGNVHYVEEDYWPHDTTLYIKDFKGNLPRFVYYFFKQFPISQYEASAANPSLNRNNLHPVQVNWPPLPEQKRIAAILDKADEIRRKRARAIKLTEELLRSAFLEMFGDPVTNPKGWKVKKLGEVCQKVTDGTHQSPKFQTFGIPFLFISNILGGKMDFSTKKYISESTWSELTRTTPIEQGDILYATVGSYGNAVLVDTQEKFAFQRHIAHIKPDADEIKPQFLLAQLMSSGVRHQVDRLVRGVAQKTLNLGDLKNVQIVVPPMEQQVRFLDAHEKLRPLLATCVDATRWAGEAGRSLTQRAFRGEL